MAGMGFRAPTDKGCSIQGTVTQPSKRPRPSRRLLRARLHPQAAGPRHHRPLVHFGVITSILLAVIFFGRFPVTVSGSVPQPTMYTVNLSLPGLASAATAGVVPNEMVASPQPLTVTAPAAVQDQVVTAQNGTAAAVAALTEKQRTAAVAAETVTAAAVQQQRLPVFYEYKIQPGDTVSGIATRFHIGSDYIVWNNGDISDRDALQVGTTLQIPSVEGIIHSVRSGETVSEVAQRYQADPRDIVEFAANGLQDDPNRLRTDALVLVPGGKKIPPPAPTLRPTLAAPAPAPVPVVTAGDADSYAWPTRGPITSYFGPSHPLGIDIAPPWGSAVTAARAGTVSFAGGNPCCSYGLHVIIDHGNGWETMYAHLSSINVVRGQRVKRGDLLGAVGATGYATGPHLHFEVDRNGSPLDPLSFLP
jgi:murein DD-endopeptidase MepM/ murein hydrolase activator NlpD